MKLAMASRGEGSRWWSKRWCLDLVERERTRGDVYCGISPAAPAPFARLGTARKHREATAGRRQQELRLTYKIRGTSGVRQCSKSTAVSVAFHRGWFTIRAVDVFQLSISSCRAYGCLSTVVR